MKAWPTPGLFPVLAHQGGWDETLLVVGPLLVIGGALWLVNKRVTSRLEAEPAPADADAGADPPGGASGDQHAGRIVGDQGPGGPDRP